MNKSKWIDRQVDEALLTASTVTGILYARRRARRMLPKAIAGGVVVAAMGSAAVVAAAGIGVLGTGVAGAAGAAWYRHRKKAASATDWQPPTPARESFVAKDARPAATSAATSVGMH
jgi:hypothetical protein